MKGEDVTEGKPEDDPACLCARPGSDRNDRIVLFHHAIHMKRWRPDEILVLDLAIEGFLALEMLEAREVPDNVVGQASEDLLMVGLAEPVEVARYDALACGHLPPSLGPLVLTA